MSEIQMSLAAWVKSTTRRRNGSAPRSQLLARTEARFW